MRKIQKIIIIIYFAVIATACIYVPWMFSGVSTSSESIPSMSLGYSLIWKPILVALSTEKPPTIPATILDFKRVVLELIAITAVFGILFVLTLRPKQKEE